MTAAGKLPTVAGYAREQLIAPGPTAATWWATTDTDALTLVRKDGEDLTETDRRAQARTEACMAALRQGGVVYFNAGAYAKGVTVLAPLPEPAEKHESVWETVVGPRGGRKNVIVKRVTHTATHEMQLIPFDYREKITRGTTVWVPVPGVEVAA